MGNVPSSWTRRMVPGAGAATHAAEPAPEARPLTTFFDDGCQIDGRLVVRTSIEIDSEFRGRIESEQTVTVGPDATVEGGIQARIVRVDGAVAGDIEGSREVVIGATGRVHGDISTPCLVVERGAFFNGQTQMYRPEIAVRMNADGDETPAPTAE